MKLTKQEEVAFNFVCELKIFKLHKLVVTGLVNGLSHTETDGRIEDINFWRKRCNLFNMFTLCVIGLCAGQNIVQKEKELKELAERGY